METKELRSLMEVANQVAAGNSTVESVESSEESLVLEYFERYFEDGLTEDTSDEDIIEAVDSLVSFTECVFRVMEDDEVHNDVVEMVSEYLNGIIEGGLTEDTSDEDIQEAITSLTNLTESVLEYTGFIEEGKEKKKGKTRKGTNAEY